VLTRNEKSIAPAFPVLDFQCHSMREHPPEFIANAEIRGGLLMSCDNHSRSTDDILVVGKKRHDLSRSAVFPQKLLSNPFLDAPLPTSNASLMRLRSFSRGRSEDHVEGIRNCSPSRQQDVPRIVR